MTIQLLVTGDQSRSLLPIFTAVLYRPMRMTSKNLDECGVLRRDPGFRQIVVFLKGTVRCRVLSDSPLCLSRTSSFCLAQHEANRG